MTSKDYIEIADALVLAYKDSQTDEEVHYELLKDIVFRLSRLFYVDNNKFDKHKFIDYIEKGIS